MVPFVGVPETITSGMSAYREVFCREAGFEQVSRYVSGLLLSENKTLQGIHAQQVYLEGEEISRRAMHAAVFEAGWDSEDLMRQHRLQVGQRHQGREIISLDWTLSHHEAWQAHLWSETSLRLCQPLHELLSNGGDCRDCQSSTNRWHCSRSPVTGL